MKKQRGFTLIELMIAMAIIAILATAGISAYTGYVKKSRDTARAQIASNLNTAVMSYAASNGGNPPASNEAFSQFLASTSEAFGGGSGGGNLSIEDPIGGKNVCLDAEGHADQPCSFNYTAYDDGTYAISYGVEDISSTEGNFYKTTASVVAPGLKDQTQVTGLTASIPKYGVYIGSAKYIGQTATQDNGGANDGVDEKYTPAGETVAQPLNPIFRSIRVDSPGGVTEIASGDICTQLDICEGALSCISGQCRTSNVASNGACDVSEQCTSSLSCIINQCRTANVASGNPCDVTEQCVSELICSPTSYTCITPPPVCGVNLTIDGYATVVAEDGKCWLATNLGTTTLGGYGNYYQWNKITPVWTSGWNGTGTGSGDPCPAGFHTPTITEWQYFVTKANQLGTIDLTNSILNLPKTGRQSYTNGSVYSSQGVLGYYWSSSPNSWNAYDLDFNSTGTTSRINNRAGGMSVRCLQN